MALNNASGYGLGYNLYSWAEMRFSLFILLSLLCAYLMFSVYFVLRLP